MERSKRAKGSRGQPLALELLMSDHRKVDEMFRLYEKRKDGDDALREMLAQRICAELAVHVRVEEELFYPWLRENMDDASLVDEALVEHMSAKDLVAQIEGASEIDEMYDAKVKVLGEYVRHHVKEEENEIFRAVRGMEEDLDELGQEMAARKAELMAEMGLDSGSEEGDAPGAMRAATRRGGRKAGAAPGPGAR